MADLGFEPLNYKTAAMLTKYFLIRLNRLHARARPELFLISPAYFRITLLAIAAHIMNEHLNS